MCFVDSVFAVYVAYTQERVVSFLHQGYLVHRSVGAQDLVLLVVVSVGKGARNVILGNE